MQRLILIASPTLRRGPLSALQRFVHDHEEFLQRFEIVTTEGCRRALLRSGLLLGHQNFQSELPGHLGGVVHLSSLVVNSPESLEAVIYLIDPKDPSSIYPETNAIKRECVVKEVTFLSTSRAAREWATIKWAESSPQFARPEDTDGLRLVRTIDEETIALIAHDGKKRELLEFAIKHFDFLQRFKERVATGTTGTLLNGKTPDRQRLTAKECEELAPLCAQLKHLIDARVSSVRRSPEDAEPGKLFVTEKASGPRGGDVMIARMVLADACHRIVFFENPHEPHEHTEDIQLLERTGRLRGKSTMCIHDSRTAELFVKNWKASSDAAPADRLLLSTVLERLFGVRCVLVETSAYSKQTWESIRNASSWFLLSHVSALANERKRYGQNVNLTVSWGVGCSEVANELPRRLQQLVRKALEPQSTADLIRDDLEDFGVDAFDSMYRYQTPSLADERYFRPGNVVVAPVQGLVGSEDEAVEANEIAHRVAEFFGGGHVPLAANVRVRRGGDGERRRTRLEKLTAHWSSTDILIATAGPLVEDYGDRPQTPHFKGFVDDMRKSGACGDIGGLFLNSKGEEVLGENFDRVGMSADQVRAVRKRRGLILVSGAQMQRATITLAALRRGWVSVLVTDIEFAREIVRLASALKREGRLEVCAPHIRGPVVISAQ